MQATNGMDREQRLLSACVKFALGCIVMKSSRSADIGHRVSSCKVEIEVIANRYIQILPKLGQISVKMAGIISLN